MGFLSNLPVAQFEGITLYKDKITKGRESFPLTDVSALVEAGSAREKRITLTRVAAIGIFALAAKKKSGGEVYLTVEGPEFVWSVEVDHKRQAKAREFALKVRQATKGS